MTAVGLLLGVALLVLQLALTQTILPSILDLNLPDLNVTLESSAWRLSLVYFVFLVLDLLWTIAAVVLYFNSQSRRMATDLRARLSRVVGATA